MMISPGFIFSQAERSGRLKALFDACDQPGIPGGFAVAVVKDGKVVFKKGYGYANYEHKIPFTTKTVFDYASVAKQFTGFAVATLVKQGKLRLNDDIRQYLPEVPGFGEKITVRHLLYHSSGIRDWVGLVKISGRYKSDVIKKEFIMKLVKNQEDLNFKPGERFKYSNTGYFLLAGIVSRITKTPFRQWTRENIFKPLGMKDTLFRDDHREIILNRASSYLKNEKGEFVNSSSHLESCGSSSLFSTVDDMIKWVVNYETNELGGPDIRAMMIKKGTLNNNKEIDYGYGLSMTTRRGFENIIHGGGWCGYVCQLSYFPALNLTYILISNRDPSGVYVDNGLLELFRDKKEKKETVRKRNIPPQRKEVEIDPQHLGEFTGYYQYFSHIIRIEKKDRHLVVHYPWGNTIGFYPESKKKFFSKKFDGQFTFLRDKNGKVNRYIYHYHGSENPPFKKLFADVSGYTGARELCGDYHCPELQTTYKILIKDNRLMVTHLHNEDVLLLRVDKDNYKSEKWWFSKIRLTRDENDRVTGFKLNADDNNIQGLVFEKTSA
jgi:CubicO group peptidase (beta-lactamase class C family)